MVCLKYREPGGRLQDVLVDGTVAYPPASVYWKVLGIFRSGGEIFAYMFVSDCYECEGGARDLYVLDGKGGLSLVSPTSDEGE